MRSIELPQWMRQWLDNPGEDQLLVVDEGALWLQQRAGKWYALAALMGNMPPDDDLLSRALQLTAPALRHFGREAAALGLRDGHLVLILRFYEPDSDAVIQQLESLLNQRDVWQAMLHQRHRKATLHGTLPLHSLALFSGGNYGQQT